MSYKTSAGGGAHIASDYNKLIPSDWFDVAAYGAVGDGATNDTAAINSAVAALNTNGGGILYFPQTAAGGNYKMTAIMTPITSNTCLLGSYGSKISVASLTSNPDFIALGDNCEVEDLQFAVTGAGSVIRCNGENNRVSHCAFLNSNSQVAVRLSNTEQSIHDNLFNSFNGGTACIQVDNGAYRTNMHDNTFEAVNPSTKPLILVKAGQLEFTIVDNTSANCSATYAVQIEVGASDWYIVTGNNFIGLSVLDGGTGTNKLVTDNPFRAGAPNSAFEAASTTLRAFNTPVTNGSLRRTVFVTVDLDSTVTAKAYAGYITTVAGAGVTIADVVGLPAGAALAIVPRFSFSFNVDPGAAYQVTSDVGAGGTATLVSTTEVDW